MDHLLSFGLETDVIMPMAEGRFSESKVHTLTQGQQVGSHSHDPKNGKMPSSK